MTTNSPIEKPKSKKINPFTSTEWLDVTIHLQGEYLPDDFLFAINVLTDEIDYIVWLGTRETLALPVNSEIFFKGNQENSKTISLYLNADGELYIPIENTSAKMVVDKVVFDDLPGEDWNPITGFKITQTPGVVPSIGILIVGTLPDDEDKK